MQIKELINQWLADKQKRVKISSYAIYVTNIENHILPFFGEMEEITIDDVNRFVEQKQAAGCSANTISSLVTMVKSVVRYADKRGLMSIETLKPYRAPRKKSEQILVTLSSEQEKKIMNYIYSNLTAENLGIAFGLQAGLRIGEICGLKWSDIDFAKGKFTVCRTVERIYVSENNTKFSKVIISEPKSVTSVREVPLEKTFMKHLRMLKPEDTDTYVLTGFKKPTEPRAYRNIFTRMMYRLGIPRAKFGILRNTYAIRSLTEGVSYEELTMILGISAPTITRSMYKVD